MSLSDVEAARIGQALIQARHAIDDALRLVQPGLEVQRDAPGPQVVPLTGVCQHGKAQRTAAFGGKTQCYCPDCHAQWTE